jgi:hypothetical protein
MRKLCHLVGALLLGLVACAGPSGVPFPEVAATIPPIPSGEGRIYFYRDYEPYESLALTEVFLNGATAGVSGGGGEGGGYDPDTFVVMLIDPAQAQRELANMRYVQPPSGVARAS